MKKEFSFRSAVTWIIFAFVFTISFGTKKFLFSFDTSWPHDVISEYGGAFLYLGDIFAGIIIVCAAHMMRSLPQDERRKILRSFFVILPLIAFLAFSAASLASAVNAGLGMYAWIRLVSVAALAVALAVLFRGGFIRMRAIMSALAFSGVFQAIVGFAQFVRGRSVGFFLLGEPLITETTKGVGRVLIQGVRFLRAQGTMPHANILAAFLILGLVALYYLFFVTAREKKYFTQIMVVVGIVLSWVGLIVTFSRSGWITAAAATIFFLLWTLFKSEHRMTAVRLSVLLATLGVLLWIVFGWAISPRAQFPARDTSIINRLVYNNMGLELVSAYPFGVGIGSQVERSVADGLFQARGLSNWWDWQPIHNLYLLMASEIGIQGVIGFLVFLVTLVVSRWKREEVDVEKITAYCLLCSVLVFGLFDHFFWDLQSGRLMFWVVLGILMGTKKETV